uniref:Pancreatic triacylglycerol lipase n=1 Tax=Anoplophora glabripennis TaxID=217634 RepID=V5I8F5_ANOGL
MKVSLLVAALFPLVLSGPAFQCQSEQEDDGADMKYFLYESSPGVYKVEDLVNAEIDTMVSQSDVYYHFFSRSDPNGVDIRNTNIDALRNTGFSDQRDTVFIVHGWRGDNDASSNRNIRQAILSKHNINLFVVDWGPIASRNYITAKNSVVRVGRIVASFVQALQSRFSVRCPQSPLLASLLVPMFLEQLVLLSRHKLTISWDWTLLVRCSLLGTLTSAWTRLMPNSSRSSTPTEASSASGIRLVTPTTTPTEGLLSLGVVWISSVTALIPELIYITPKAFWPIPIVSCRCNVLVIQYTRGNCNDNAKSVLGGYTVDKRANGDFYLDTNNQSPFARG